MFNGVQFKFGSSQGEESLEIEPSPMVVFVGPNNSGKSLVLRELLATVNAGQPPQSAKVVAGVCTPVLDADAALAVINGRKDEAKTQLCSPGQVYLSSYHPVSGKNQAHEISLNEALRFLCDPNPEYRPHSLTYIYSHYAVSLDGQTRLSILDSRPASGQLKNPTNVLGRLFVDDGVREQIRIIGGRAFGKFLVIDPTSMVNFEVRLSDRPPTDTLEEQALNDRAREFHGSDVPPLSVAGLFGVRG